MPFKAPTHRKRPTTDQHRTSSRSSSGPDPVCPFSVRRQIVGSAPCSSNPYAAFLEPSPTHDELDQIPICPGARGPKLHRVDESFHCIRRGSGKPRLVYPGARLAREEASSPPPGPSRAVGPYRFGHLRCSEPQRHGATTGSIDQGDPEAPAHLRRRAGQAGPSQMSQRPDLCARFMGHSTPSRNAGTGSSILG